MFRRHKPGGDTGDSGEDREVPGAREGPTGPGGPQGRRRARHIIPMVPRRGGGRKKPEPEFRGTDIFALVVAGLQVILPYFFIILAAIVGTYLLVAAFFGM